MCALLAFYVCTRHMSFDHRPLAIALTGTLVGILLCNAIFITVRLSRLPNVDDASLRCIIVTRNFLLWTSTVLLCIATPMLLSLWRCARGLSTRYARYLAYVSFVLMALSVMDLLLLSVYSNVKRCDVLVLSATPDRDKYVLPFLASAGGLGKYVDMTNIVDTESLGQQKGYFGTASPVATVIITEVVDSRKVSLPSLDFLPQGIKHCLVVLVRTHLDELTIAQEMGLQEYLTAIESLTEGYILDLPFDFENKRLVFTPLTFYKARRTVSKFLNMACSNSNSQEQAHSDA